MQNTRAPMLIVSVASMATAMAGTAATSCTGWFVAASAGPGPITWSATLKVLKPSASACRAWSRQSCGLDAP